MYMNLTRQVSFLNCSFVSHILFKIFPFSKSGNVIYIKKEIATYEDILLTVMGTTLLTQTAHGMYGRRSVMEVPSTREDNIVKRMKYWQEHYADRFSFRPCLAKTTVERIEYDDKRNIN